MKFTKILASYLIILFLLGCNPMKLPRLRDFAKKEDERIYAFTKETIAKSSELQDLDKFCKKLPLVKDFTLLQMSISNDKRMLFYHYYSAQKYVDVSSIFTQKLANDGLSVVKVDFSGGPVVTEFVGDKHLVTLSYQHSDSPEDDWNFAIDCGLR